MKILYDVAVEDLVAFNIFNSKRSPTLRRTHLLLRWSFTLAFLVGTAAIGYYFENWTTPILGAVGGVSYYLWFPRTMRKSTAKLVKRTLAESNSGTFPKEHELEITEDDMLIEREGGSETRTPISKIGGVFHDNQRAYVYIAPNAAHVVPHGSIKEGDYNEFVELLVSKLDATKAG